MATRTGFKRSAVGFAAVLALAPNAQAADHTWSSGTFVGGVTAPNPLAAGDTLNIVTGGFKYFDGASFVFTNDGNVVWSTTNFIYMQNGAGVVNNGVWNSTASHTLQHNGGAAASFVNNGVFRSSAGADTVTIGANTGFVNNGTIDAQVGRIAFDGGATFNAGSVFTGSGSVVANTGTQTFNGSFTSANLLLEGGVFVGNAAVANGTVAYTGGTLAGGWTVATGAALNVSTGAFKYVDGAVVNNGTVNWNTTNYWYLQNGSGVTNNGLFTAAQDTTLTYNGGTATSFTNTAGATLRAQAGTTLSLGSSLGFVNNGGVLDALAGATVAIAGGAQLNGGSYTGAGSVTVNGNNSFTGVHDSANLVVAGGTQTGTAALLNNTVRWTGGTFTGGWTLGAGSTLSAETGAFKYLDTGTFTNNGTLAWNTTNLLYMQNGGTFVNRGLFVAGADTAINDNGGAQPVFDNAATGIVRAAVGSTVSIGSVLVNNGGRLDAETGATLVYTGGGTFNDNTRFTGAGVNRVDGDAAFNGSIHSDNLVLQGGDYTATAAVLDGSTGWTGGRFVGGWTLAGGATLTAGTGAFKYLGAGTFISNGAMAWNSTNLLYMENGANWVNNGSFVANVSTTIIDNGGTQPILTNTASGLLRASGGSTLAVGDVLRNTGGQLDAAAGSAIRYTGGAVFDNGTRFTGAGSNVVAGSSAFNGAIQSANLLIESGTQTGGAAVLAGSTRFTGGRLEGTWQFAPGSSVVGGDGGFKYVSGGGVVDNRGTLVWETTNALYFEDGGRIDNAGTLDLRSDGSFLNNGSPGGVVNTGLIVRTTSGGTFTIGANLPFVNQGTVEVRTGTLALPTNFTNNGVLMGTGTYAVGGATGLTNGSGGVLAPGSTTAPGTMALAGNFSQLAGGTFAVDLESLGSSDLFNVSGAAALAGALSINCFAACSYAVGDVITILDSVGNLTGTFTDGVTLSGFATGAFDVVYDTAADRVQLLVTQTVTAVPEPAPAAMLLSGLVALGWAARRRRAA